MRASTFWPLVAALLVGACSTTPQVCMNDEVRDSQSLVTVLAPDGSEVCDATVLVFNLQLPVEPGPNDAGCVYAASNLALGNGDWNITARKPGYLDADGTIHVSGAASHACAPPAPVGENITLHLVPAEGGVPDSGAPDGGTSDAGS